MRLGSFFPPWRRTVHARGFWAIIGVHATLIGAHVRDAYLIRIDSNRILTFSRPALEAQAQLEAEKASMLAERERVAAETAAAKADAEEARRQMEEAALARQEQLAAEALAAQEAALARLTEEAALHEAATEARLAAEAAAQRLELEAQRSQMAAEVEAEKAKMMADAKAQMAAEKAAMAKEMAEMKAQMQAQVAAEAERSAAVATEKLAAEKAREEALASAATVQAQMEAERKARLAAEEEASAKAQQLEREHAIDAARAEEQDDHAASEQGLKDQLAAFEAKLKEEQEKSKSGFEEQKRLREKLIKEQEGRLKATQQGIADRKAQVAKDREKERLERQRKTEEAATAQSEKDEEDEKRAREKAKQEARAALAKSMGGAKASPGASAEAKLRGSMDFNLKKATPKASGREMFRQPTSRGSLASMGGLASGPGQSNNPFALPTAGAAAINLPPPIAASSNPFALPPATGAPPPMIPSRSSGPRATFNTDPGAHLNASLLTSGHTGANTKVAPTTMDAYGHSSRGPATGAADYFGGLGAAEQTSPFAAHPHHKPATATDSTSPFGSPFGAPPPATSKDAFMAAHGNDPYSNPTSPQSQPQSNAASDDELDFDPTQWNGKGGSSRFGAVTTASMGSDIGATTPVSPSSVASVTTSPRAPDNGLAGGGSTMTDKQKDKQKHDAMVEGKIQQMMSLQREHMASRTAADEAQKKLAARHAEAEQDKKKTKKGFFSGRKK